PAIEGALATRAWVDVAWRRHARGEATELDALIASAHRDCDAIVITGGISMGHRDPVRAAVERLGARVIFHGLPQRPGKPMLGAVSRRADGRPLAVFGLPGNPLSALVTLERVAMPVLAHLGGGRGPCHPLVRLSNPDGQTLPLWWHRLVRLNAAGEAELVSVRSSGDVVAGGAGDGFIEVTPGAASDPHGPFAFHAWPR
ncbi:MAG: molybdopterin-binding protein, partial [Planctomycetota bacterium]